MVSPVQQTQKKIHETKKIYTTKMKKTADNDTCA